MSNVSTEVKSIAEIVKGRMQGSIAELIPAEAFDKMLEQAVEYLVNPSVYQSKLRPEVDWNGNRRDNGQKAFKISPMQQIMENIIYDELNARIKTELKKPEWQSSYDGMFTHTSSAVSKAVEDNAEILLRQMFRTIIGASVQESINAFRAGI